MSKTFNILLNRNESNIKIKELGNTFSNSDLFQAKCPYDSLSIVVSANNESEAIDEAIVIFQEHLHIEDSIIPTDKYTSIEDKLKDAFDLWN